MKYIIFLIFSLLDIARSELTCSKNKTITLECKDYSKLPVFKSNLERSDLISSRTNFNWADIYLELDDLFDYYSPPVALGRVTPDFLPAPQLLNGLLDVAQNQTEESYMTHQYTRTKGHPRLVIALAKYSSKLMNRQIDPEKEVLVTVGASNALVLAFQAFLDYGDEVIVFEPFYFDYYQYINFVGAKLVYVPLRVKKGANGAHSNDWSFERSELKGKITRKTKMILLNNPNNPFGKAYNLDELAYIGHLAEKYNLVIISDEAAENYYYEKPGHIKIASLPNMFKRTITINSGGKLFICTGWRIGWAIAPENMLWAMAALTETVISVQTPLQIAYAKALENELKIMGTPDSWSSRLKNYSKYARNRIIHYLNLVGADYVIPAAGYTMLVNFTRLADQIDLSKETDCRPGMRFIKFLIKKGLNVSPGSIFFGPQNQWRTEYVVRLTNLKNERTIDNFGRLLTKIFRIVKDPAHINHGLSVWEDESEKLPDQNEI